MARPAAAGGLRWWRRPAMIVALAGLTAAYIWLIWNRAMDFKVLATEALIGLTLVLLAAWFGSCSRFSRRVRTITLSATGVLVVLVLAFVQVEHYSGDLVPKLTWRWKRKPHELLERIAPQGSTSADPADAPGGGDDADSGERTVDLSTRSEHDYPQFLGPNRNATIERVRLGRDWEARTPRRVWRHKIGAGWSSFAVVGRHAVTQEQRGNDELVVCYDVFTGELEWAHVDPLAAPFVSKIAGDGPRATPTIDQGRVYTSGGTGLLNCLDGATGRRIWSRDVLAENQATVPKWGYSCSPLIVNDRVLVTGGGANGPALLAYDKLTGAELARGGDPVNSDAYSSPVLAELCGVRQILLLNDMYTAGYDATSLVRLWTYDWAAGSPKVSQPVPLPGDRVFTSVGYGHGSALVQLVRSADGVVAAEPVWANTNLKTKFTNVVLLGDYVYGLDEGILQCVELETGEEQWKEGRYGHGQVLLAGDLLLVQAETGEVVLVEATPAEFRELTSFQALDDRTWNNPALSGRYLLVRNDREAACYELSLEEEP
jgi:outer membrane protein assembly factor BamB